jgi:hypothetical protein
MHYIFCVALYELPLHALCKIYKNFKNKTFLFNAGDRDLIFLVSAGVDPLMLSKR